jgi:spore germination protein AB
MTPSIPENKKISPFLVFFLVAKMQIGIGVLGFQRIIAQSAGYDAWISIIITGLAIQIILWMMFKMAKIVDGDIISIHHYIFGNKFGKIISFPLILYFCLWAITILRNYIEIVQVWMFPELNTFWFALVFLVVVIYIIHGGFRTVTGIAFFGIVLPFYIFVFILFTLPFAEFDNLLPIYDHSVKDILMASKNMSLTILGFEAILIFYPFVKTPEKSKRWGHLAILYTTLISLYLAVITFAYFPEAQLEKNIWATLTMWKIIELPFVERFEYIGIANWSLIILPNVTIAIWCASRLTKRIFSIKQKFSAPSLAIICLVSISMLITRNQINTLANILSNIGFYFNFAYIPLLFFATHIAKKVKKR